MAFKKGQSGNPNGRKVGTANKATTDLRQWITNFIDDNREQIQQDWQALDPKDRILLFEKLLKYALPTLQATTLTTDLQTLSDEQLDILTQRILNG